MTIQELIGIKQSTYKYFNDKDSLYAIRKDWSELRFVKNKTFDVCLEAVRENGYALQFVEEQTHDLCLEAVRENGLALQYVKEQTHDLCLEAVREDGHALQYVKDKTFEIYLEALSQNGGAIQYVNEDIILNTEPKTDDAGQIRTLATNGTKEQKSMLIELGLCIDILQYDEDEEIRQKTGNVLKRKELLEFLGIKEGNLFINNEEIIDSIIKNKDTFTNILNK